MRRPISTLTPPLLLLALAGPAAADDTAEVLDRVGKAVESLGARDGYGVDADWTLEGEKLKEPVKGKVRSVIRHKDAFVMLRGTFEDGRDATVYQKGEVIAAQDAETQSWGPVSGDARAKFVLQMFNMRSFLERSRAMGVRGRFERAEDEGFLRLVWEADAAKLKDLLTEAEAGKALVNGVLENATMRVALEVRRGTNEPRRLEVVIHADSTRPPVREGSEAPPDEWGTEPRRDDEPWGDEETPKEPEKKEPAAPREPVKERITVTIRATPDLKASLDVPVPDEARKVLGN
ncbi:MAG: hypothetical protein HUU15_03320 [Candidatus Brocadiae bacterium]|nr:hypothetical protein [Candidatus Brocadiia bacterium]